MRVTFRRGLIALVLAGSSLTLTGAPAAQAEPNEHASDRAKERSHAVCTPVSDEPSCGVYVDGKPGGSGTPSVTVTSPVGFGPDQFHTAYNVPTTATTPVTIGIVAAYDNPNAKADLDVYNSTFGLPAFPNCSVTVTTGCFEKVKQKTNISTNESWIVESTMDVQISHMMCQNCKILLVEAASSGISDLLWANDKAYSMGAKVINNSWGRLETSTTPSYDFHFNHPGVVYVASSGDHGYESHYPASSPYVVAVGGTTLSIDGANNWVGETAWSKGGSYCSTNEPKPTHQTDLGCLKRSVVDVSADADDVNSGAAVYDSFGVNGNYKWLKVGGTSLAAPLITGIYGLNGGVPAGVQANSLPYTHGNATNLHDVTSGSNGTCGTYLCNAGVGYDGPTGLGTPNGLTAFK